MAFASPFNKAFPGGRLTKKALFQWNRTFLYNPSVSFADSSLYTRELF